jgi:hypothetical protein
VLLVILCAEMDLVLTQGNDVTNFSTAQMELMRETVVSLGIPKTHCYVKYRNGFVVMSYSAEMLHPVSPNSWGLCQLVNRARASELQSQFSVCMYHSIVW